MSSIIYLYFLAHKNDYFIIKSESQITFVSYITVFLKDIARPLNDTHLYRIDKADLDVT